MRLALLLLLFLTSCSDSPKSEKSALSGEYITRSHDDFHYIAENQVPMTRKLYPWEKPLVGNHPPISKEHFRCKGSSLNPVRIYNNGKETVRLYDCGGSTKHSLPLHEGKEFVYPILIKLFNYIQAKTERRVVVTCGHRCPEHNGYSNPEDPYSKHLVGAEASFYVQGLESEPERIVTLIQNYYREKESSKEYLKFERYTKGDSHVSTAPWYNKEVFIKLFKQDEGRDFDNRHPYPYISIQVRYDRMNDQRVLYDWNAAHKNYLRK